CVKLAPWRANLPWSFETNTSVRIWTALATTEYMNETFPLTQRQLPEYLLHVATVRPVMILGAPGIGKTALVQQFAEMVGLVCVSLLGSQLAPEDLIGVPQLLPNGKSRFCPPTTWRCWRMACSHPTTLRSSGRLSKLSATGLRLTAS